MLTVAGHVKTTNQRPDTLAQKQLVSPFVAALHVLTHAPQQDAQVVEYVHVFRIESEHGLETQNGLLQLASLSKPKSVMAPGRFDLPDSDTLCRYLAQNTAQISRERASVRFARRF